MTDEQGYIVREWRYDLGAHMPPPAGVVLAVKLNRSISFEFQNRAEMLIKFAHDGVLRDLKAGVRPKREGSYLDNRYIFRRMTSPRRQKGKVGFSHQR